MTLNRSRKSFDETLLAADWKFTGGGSQSPLEENDHHCSCHCNTALASYDYSGCPNG